jgi:predicted unusual protein kinase regulating ubiquinone biosynthesis (AarF/ABC1/UbiB family)
MSEKVAHSTKLLSVSPKKQNVKNTVQFLLSYQFRFATMRNKGNLAKWAKAELSELGPTFIKMGQFVSTRSDIFDKEVIDEMQTLQDRASPFPAEDARLIISKELGMPYDEIFTDFQDVPVASASISQVHRAKLVTNGKEVVIKVQRPFISDYFDRDFTTMRMLFNLAGVVDSRSIQDSKMLLDDCYKYMYEELAFEKEVANLQKFQEILSNNTEIMVPRVYPEYSSSKIITMSYVPSDKIGSLAGVDRSLLASVLMECFIKQILEHGVIHADPHPGNIGLTKEGKIVLYDFGQVTTLEDKFVKSVKPLLFSLYEKDVDSVASIMIETGSIILTKTVDKRSLRDFIGKIVQYFEKVDFKEFQLSMINSDFDEMDFPFKINSKLIMVFRSLSLLEGICKDLDPEFSYFKVINMLMSDFFLDMDYLDHRARKDVKSLFEAPANPKADIESLQTNLEASNRKQTRNMNSTLQQYQKAMFALVLMNVWDFENIPKSMAIASGFIFLLLKL